MRLGKRGIEVPGGEGVSAGLAGVGGAGGTPSSCCPLPTQTPFVTPQSSVMQAWD